RLLFPLARLKVGTLPFDECVSKYPRRTSGQHAHALEERAILENAAAGQELPETGRIESSQLRADRQDRLCLCGEIERLFRFVIVDAVHPVAIVEQRRGVTGAVHQKSLKSPVQSCGE